MHSAGKADWTMTVASMVGFAPSFMDKSQRERAGQYVRHGVSLDWSWLYVFQTLHPTTTTSTPAWTQLQPTPETMSEQPVSNVLQVQNVLGLRNVSGGRWFPPILMTWETVIGVKWCLSLMTSNTLTLCRQNTYFTYILIRTGGRMGIIKIWKVDIVCAFYKIYH